MNEGIKTEKMTLNGYYKSLLERKTPLQDFISEVMERTGKSEQTVRNWCIYGKKPQSYADVKVLMDITGLKEEELWESK